MPGEELGGEFEEHMIMAQRIFVSGVIFCSCIGFKSCRT